MVHQNVDRRGVQAPIPHEFIEDGSADRAVSRRGACSRPESLQAFPSLGGAAARHPVGERDRVHGAGTGAADRLDANSLVPEELVENTPGEGTVRAAALQRKFDRLFRLPVHPISPDPAHRRRRARAASSYPGRPPAGKIATNARPVNARKQILSARLRPSVLMRTASVTCSGAAVVSSSNSSKWSLLTKAMSSRSTCACTGPMAPLRKAFPLLVGLRVRIRLPPAASLLRT